MDGGVAVHAGAQGCACAFVSACLLVSVHHCIYLCVSTWEITLPVSMHAHFTRVTNSCRELMSVDLI